MRISELICRRFSFSQSELSSYANTCPFRYKTYTIDKRQGGTRVISQPSKDLKAVQRFILDEYLTEKLKIHHAAKAYKVGTNILANATPHLNNRFLLKMDFKDFFPSIHGIDFFRFLLDENIVCNEIDANILVKIFFKDYFGILALSIGSPGSPTISNAIIYEFDDVTSNYCASKGITFTRYSDDLTFSTNEKNILFEVPKMILEIISNIKLPRLHINADKTVFSSKKFNRHVTGITISNEGRASLGNDKKRALRSKVFQAGTLDQKELEKLRGYLSFAQQIEEDLLAKLWKKYPIQMKVVMGSQQADSNISE